MRKENGIGVFAWAVILLVGLMMQACSVKVETQWFGQSEIDYKNTSPKK